MRYRYGALSADPTTPPDRALHEIHSISVADARKRCQSIPSCVSFAYYSYGTRFPTGNVTAFLYPYADWHLREDEVKAFREKDGYHTYVNVTREIDLVFDEVDSIITKLEGVDKENKGKGNSNESQAGGNARRKRLGGSSMSQSANAESDERKITLFSSLFEISMAKANKPIALPAIAPYAMRLATSDSETDQLRVEALKLLIVLADSPLSGRMLLDLGIYQGMKRIVDKRGETWGDVPTMALDVISNICFHRAANEKLWKFGAHTFMGEIMGTPGFPGLQATLSLAHLGERGQFDIGTLPQSQLKDLVQLLQSTIDGDVVYDIKWDLVPGPLSAVKYLVLHSTDTTNIDGLMDAGLMEELFRVIEETDCIEGDSVEYALEIITVLVDISERAGHMVLLEDHTIHKAEERLLQYDRAAKLAGGLMAAAARNGRDDEF
eukprot:CAMPEP_0201978654 /NCGR_PEP_ID=MMETSP0904-20121228/64723_1 /ASSEMBLY_ACC=CAM_ASM_000553 /TAXON_ID=420261 /ORGANISM="Thalassiosira antarctica, Strain CCMP982" /LENGTH=436 /DNA_ID=CAMNT_0048530389 /DNA_START=10 /DNA_END=1320 /DNA_ORIENTATION=+